MHTDADERFTPMTIVGVSTVTGQKKIKNLNGSKSVYYVSTGNRTTERSIAINWLQPTNLSSFDKTMSWVWLADVRAEKFIALGMYLKYHKTSS